MKKTRVGGGPLLLVVHCHWQGVVTDGYGDNDYDRGGDDQTQWSMGIAGGVDQRWECEIDAEVVECDTVP